MRCGFSLPDQQGRPRAQHRIACRQRWNIPMEGGRLSLCSELGEISSHVQVEPPGHHLLPIPPVPLLGPTEPILVRSEPSQNCQQWSLLIAGYTHEILSSLVSPHEKAENQKQSQKKLGWRGHQLLTLHRTPPKSHPESDTGTGHPQNPTLRVTLAQENPKIHPESDIGTGQDCARRDSEEEQ